MSAVASSCYAFSSARTNSRETDEMHEIMNELCIFNDNWSVFCTNCSKYVDFCKFSIFCMEIIVNCVKMYKNVRVREIIVSRASTRTCRTGCSGPGAGWADDRSPF